MPIVQDNLWKHPGHPGMIVITAHASIGVDGSLIMNYGEAEEATRRISGIQYQCAEQVAHEAVDGVYGFLPVRPSRPEAKILGFGLFQTRLNLDEPANPELIQISLERLRQFTSEHPRIKIRMNYPGIGEEGLDPQEVLPLLENMPPTVTICHNGEVPPRISTGFNSTKDLFMVIERWLQEGRSNFAVDYLVENGFERDEAANQVNAVRQAINVRAEHYARLAAQHSSQRAEQSRFKF